MEITKKATDWLAIYKLLNEIKGAIPLKLSVSIAKNLKNIKDYIEVMQSAEKILKENLVVDETGDHYEEDSFKDYQEKVNNLYNQSDILEVFEMDFTGDIKILVSPQLLLLTSDFNKLP